MIIYKTQQHDTINSICEQFNISKDILKELNLVLEPLPKQIKIPLNKQLQVIMHSKKLINQISNYKTLLITKIGFIDGTLEVNNDQQVTFKPNYHNLFQLLEHHHVPEKQKCMKNFFIKINLDSIISIEGDRFQYIYFQSQDFLKKFKFFSKQCLNCFIFHKSQECTNNHKIKKRPLTETFIEGNNCILIYQIQMFKTSLILQYWMISFLRHNVHETFENSYLAYSPKKHGNLMKSMIQKIKDIDESLKYMMVIQFSNYVICIQLNYKIKITEKFQNDSFSKMIIFEYNIKNKPNLFNPKDSKVVLVIDEGIAFGLGDKFGVFISQKMDTIQFNKNDTFNHQLSGDFKILEFELWAFN